MIKVFTLDPSSIRTIDDIFELRARFGIEQFRLLWKFPTRWNFLLKENLKSRFKTKERKKAYLLLEKLSDFIIEIPENVVKDENSITLESWIIKADELYSTHKHNGIISNKNPNSKPHIKSIDELESWEEFNTSDCSRVKREAEEMSGCAAPLLYGSSQIHFVDPYFQMLGDKHIRPLEVFIKQVFGNLRSNNNVELYYHTGDSVLGGNIELKLKPIFERLLPKKTTIKIVRWPDNSLHNRFILTDIGGISFGIGLDDWDNGNHIEFDDISPITKENCKSKSPNGFPTFFNYAEGEKYSEIIEFSR
ncbi:MAG: hypothetical protein QY331_01985 [Melioribacteraceae bacterium]|nr:MAG: hypothetical protein QY331_01985 [Melioribacteraceae bacterium]